MGPDQSAESSINFSPVSCGKGATNKLPSSFLLSPPLSGPLLPRPLGENQQGDKLPRHCEKCRAGIARARSLKTGSLQFLCLVPAELAVSVTRSLHAVAAVSHRATDPMLGSCRLQLRAGGLDLRPRIQGRYGPLVTSLLRSL